MRPPALGALGCTGSFLIWLWGEHFSLPCMGNRLLLLVSCGWRLSPALLPCSARAGARQNKSISVSLGLMELGVICMFYKQSFCLYSLLFCCCSLAVRAETVQVVYYEDKLSLYFFCRHSSHHWMSEMVRISSDYLWAWLVSLTSSSPLHLCLELVSVAVT